MKLVFLAGLATAASLAVAAPTSALPACAPFVNAPDVTTVPGSVIGSGGTVFCFGTTYHWLGSIQDDEGHSASIGGTATGNMHASGSIGCLRPDGSPRNVRAVLRISFGGVTKTATSAFVACHH
jgi:hypothetical protein